MVLNTRKSAERSRFDAAHELGHLVLHGGERRGHGLEAEDEANSFAATFLMPRAGVLAQQLYEATPAQVVAAKKQWRVSAMALARRLYDLELLSEWRYKIVSKSLNQMGYRCGEPVGMAARESSQLLSKVFNALREEGQLSLLTDELHITTDELNSHVFGLVPLAIDGGGELTPPARPQLQVV